jgi:hypothetical protein
MEAQPNQKPLLPATATLSCKNLQETSLSCIRGHPGRQKKGSILFPLCLLYSLFCQNKDTAASLQNPHTTLAFKAKKRTSHPNFCIIFCIYTKVASF